MARGGSGVPVAVLVLIVGAVAFRWQAMGHRGLPPTGEAVLATAGEAHGAMGGARR